MLGNHRSHGHYLSKGGDLSKMVYEVFGDTRGCCGGYGGSMHMLDRNVNFTGSTPILGSIPAIAVGQSFASKEKGEENVTVVFLGDGSAEEGNFMESVNLAANKKCKIIFVIEDNRYSVNSSHSDRKSQHYNHQSLFQGLGAKYIRQNGQNVKAVFDSASKAVDIAKETQPVVLHLDILRRHGHSGPILETKDEAYRIEDSIEYREKNDCLIIAKKEALADGFKLDEIESWIESQVAETMKTVMHVKSTIEVRNFE